MNGLSGDEGLIKEKEGLFYLMYILHYIYIYSIGSRLDHGGSNLGMILDG